MNFSKSTLEDHFEFFRKDIIGEKQTFFRGNKELRIKYADWTASGRLYGPIEQLLCEKVGPWVANTHTESSQTGATMTKAYEKARNIIKAHVNASPGDSLIMTGTGMTGALSKLQRILGLRIPEKFRNRFSIDELERSVVFISHMEHHSNHTSWLETICEVEIIPMDREGLIDLEALEFLLNDYQGRQLIVSITACSNVTGIQTPYHKIAKISHRYGGICLVDFACSAPYVTINMHPDDPDARLDAIMFSPHKFLGGPGSSGVLIFNNQLYENLIPDVPGGGTVVFTDPWGHHRYKDDIEEREDGGTPGFLQTIKAAMAIRLKEAMKPDLISLRESEINQIVFKELQKIESLVLLAEQHKDRLPIFSLYFKELPYELVVKILNDRFGIQARGGCSCAGTYGHYLLGIDREHSQQLLEESDRGCLINKPGWVRISFHPTMRDWEIYYICNALKKIGIKGAEWACDYKFHNGKYSYKIANDQQDVEEWFKLNLETNCGLLENLP